MTDLKIRDTEWGAFALELARLACEMDRLTLTPLCVGVPGPTGYPPKAIEIARQLADLVDRAKRAEEIAKDIHGFTDEDFGDAHYDVPYLDHFWEHYPRNGV